MIKKKEPYICQNADQPDKPENCKIVFDPRFTMDFTDLEPDAFLYFCSNCGPLAQEIRKAIENLSPDKAKKLAQEIDKRMS